MARLIAIVGDQGTGKTTSLRNLSPNETFIINVLGKKMTASNSRFQKARTQTDFIEDINSDVKPPKKEVVTRNKSVIELEENKLSCSVRSRTKNGRNLTTPLFVEELELIEKAVSIKAEVTSLGL